jgi:hypothetical protein
LHSTSSYTPTESEKKQTYKVSYKDKNLAEQLIEVKTTSFVQSVQEISAAEQLNNNA